MKKIIALIFALFFATAAVAESFVASEKITQQVLAGSLTQTVAAGDEIAPIRILYENIDENKHQSGGISDLGLTEKWTGPVCEIFGKISSNIAAQTINAYILVQDDEGKYAKMDITFEIKEREFKFEWNDASGEMNQSVKAGETMVPIVFDYEAISVWGVSGLPSGLKGDIDEDEHAIIIAGTVDETVVSGDYDYKVIVQDKNSKEHSLSGTISVEGLPNVASISIVENEKQKVVAGDSIKPIVFKFANVNVTENMDNFKFEQTLPGSLRISVEDDVLTINGIVAENAKDGTYSIKVIAKGEKNNDTAFASVEVAHKPVETSSSSVVASSSSEASSSSAVSSSSAEQSSSSVNSSDSKSSSSSNADDSSSSEKTTNIVTAAMNDVKFGYANNALTIAMPTSSMVRVQVFDLMGHLVESFVEPVMGSRNFSLSHLSSGNYLVRVESNAQARTVKISVK